MGLESHGIWVPGHESRDLGPGLRLILLGRLGLGQISLGQSRDKNLWDSQIPSFGTTWDSSPMGFLSPMGPIRISWDSFSMGFRVQQVALDEGRTPLLTITPDKVSPKFGFSSWNFAHRFLICFRFNGLFPVYISLIFKKSHIEPISR